MGRLKKIYIQANNSNHYYLRSHWWRILQIHWIFLKMTWNNHQDITCWEKWHMLWNVQELIINFDWFGPRKIHRFINEVIHVVQYKFNARSNNYYLTDLCGNPNGKIFFHVHCAPSQSEFLKYNWFSSIKSIWERHSSNKLAIFWHLDWNTDATI